MNGSDAHPASTVNKITWPRYVTLDSLISSPILAGWASDPFMLPPCIQQAKLSRDRRKLLSVSTYPPYEQIIYPDSCQDHSLTLIGLTQLFLGVVTDITQFQLLPRWVM